MKRIRQSFLHAWHGLLHALERERNLRTFAIVDALVLFLGAYLHLLIWEWLAVIIAGGIFLCTELLNTALERTVDVIDENRKIAGGAGFHAGLKQAKDVGASASLIALILNIVVIVMVLWPYVGIFVKK